MGMNFRETTALLREAESRDNLAAALKGGKAAKEFSKEREALGKAAGGKRKLEQADRILVNAHTEAGRLVAAAEREGVRLSREAADDIKTSTAALDERRGQLDSIQQGFNEQRDAIAVSNGKIKTAELALKKREAAASSYGLDLDSREMEVARRERAASLREAEIKRFDDWRATAPA